MIPFLKKFFLYNWHSILYDHLQIKMSTNMERPLSSTFTKASCVRRLFEMTSALLCTYLVCDTGRIHPHAIAVGWLIFHSFINFLLSKFFVIATAFVVSTLLV